MTSIRFHYKERLTVKQGSKIFRVDVATRDGVILPRTTLRVLVGCLCLWVILRVCDFFDFSKNRCCKYRYLRCEKRHKINKVTNSERSEGPQRCPVVRAVPSFSNTNIPRALSLPSFASRVFIARMHQRFWVYIMSSKSGTLYTGMTNSLDRRVYEHKHHLDPRIHGKIQLHASCISRSVRTRSMPSPAKSSSKGWLQPGRSHSSNPQTLTGTILRRTGARRDVFRTNPSRTSDTSLVSQKSGVGQKA